MFLFIFIDNDCGKWFNGVSSALYYRLSKIYLMNFPYRYLVVLPP